MCMQISAPMTLGGERACLVGRQERPYREGIVEEWFSEWRSETLGLLQPEHQEDRRQGQSVCIRSGVWSVHNQLLRELAVNGSSHRRLLTITVGQEVLRNVVCLCFCSWACCRMLQISMRSMFLPCHCDCAMGDRFWEDMLVWCGSRPAVVKTRVL